MIDNLRLTILPQENTQFFISVICYSLFTEEFHSNGSDCLLLEKDFMPQRTEGPETFTCHSFTGWEEQEMIRGLIK